jgi:hypothetical protein
MKIRNPIPAGLVLAVSLSTLDSQLSTCFAQGSLTPPGAPAPTMLTLNQMEPRTPISAPYTITKPGSYYLTTNITVTVNDAVDISANGVTLDLNGFTISSTSSFDSGTAIYLIGNEGGGIVGNTDITIFNGHITGGVTNKAGVYGGPGFNSGISSNPTGGTPYNVRVTGVTVSGCFSYGINLGTGNSTVVEFCTVNTVGGYGIEASSVSHSTAYQCGNTAIMADTASDCYGYCTGNGDGLYVNFAANNCYGNCNGSGDGIRADNANNCYGYCTGSGSGLIAFTVNNCFGTCLGAGFGIYAFNANNCYAGSTSGIGLDVSAGVATGCYGSSSGPGDGLDATAANNCYGYCLGAGDGLNVSQTASGCYGYSGGNGNGVQAGAANTCSGYANGSGVGISATTAYNCNGNSAGGVGLNATNTAENCYGNSGSGNGIGIYVYSGDANNCSGNGSGSGYGIWVVNGNADNCYGYCTGSGYGLSATCANNCDGVDNGTGTGLSANTANNCNGFNQSTGTGLHTSVIAVGCYGNSTTGTGLIAFIANSCSGSGSPNYNVTYKYNMP